MQRSAYLSEPWCSCADTRQALRACASSNLRRIGECFLVCLCAPSCDVCSDALRVFDSQFAGDQFRQQRVTESRKRAILLARLVRASRHPVSKAIKDLQQRSRRKDLSTHVSQVPIQTWHGGISTQRAQILPAQGMKQKVQAVACSWQYVESCVDRIELRLDPSHDTRVPFSANDDSRPPHKCIVMPTHLPVRTVDWNIAGGPFFGLQRPSVCQFK